MTRQTIKEKAADLFYRQGYGAASMRDIAAKSGIEAASIYNHFGSKQDLLHSICQDTFTELTNGINEHYASQKNALQQLELVVSYFLNYQAEHWAAVQVSFNEYKHLEDNYLKSYKKLRKSFEQLLTQALERGVASRKLVKYDSEWLTQTLLFAMRGGSNKLSAGQVQNTVQLFMQGLQK